MAGVAGVPAQPLAPMNTAGTVPSDDESVAVDDVVWVNRAKKAIAESRGDPHRQVQLLQHLRTVYLKQRFGRNIHKDDD
jgi:hypothetical protein